MGHVQGPFSRYSWKEKRTATPSRHRSFAGEKISEPMRRRLELTLPGGVALGSPSLQSRFSEHSNILFLDADAGLIRYSGRNDDRTATSSSVGSVLGTLVFSVILPNLLVIKSAEHMIKFFWYRYGTGDARQTNDGAASGRA